MQSKQQQAQAIIDTFSAIAGDYEATVLQGVWHGYCDSGILTDALSVKDAARIAAANIDTDSDEYFELSLQEINDKVKAIDNAGDFDCIECINAILQVCDDVEEFFDIYEFEHTF